MRENINKLLLVTKGQRKKLIFVFILMLVSAFIDVLSIGSLFQYLVNFSIVVQVIF